MQIKNIKKFIAFHAVLRIHIGYIQIRIQHFSSVRIQIRFRIWLRIQGFDKEKFKKSYN